MPLNTLIIQNLRVIDHLELSLAENVTVFCGENGAGKTSILEGIDFLSRGRTFRSRTLSPILRNNTEEITVSGKVVNKELVTTLGIQKTQKTQKLRFNQQKTNTISTLARYLPVITMHPDSHLLIQGSAHNRRNYMDWSAFHVKPEFLQDWRKFNKCLRQRNNLLREGRNSGSEFNAWTQEFYEASERINKTRSEIFNEINIIFKDFSNKIVPECQTDINYYKGWPVENTLEDTLNRAEKTNKDYKFTSWGPHRADLKITLNNNHAKLTASRGQQKLITAALLLAQIKHFQNKSTQSCIVLLDDIKAELDKEHAHALFETLQELRCQIVISTIGSDDINLDGWKDSRQFHVKQGKCKLLC